MGGVVTLSIDFDKKLLAAIDAMPEKVACEEPDHRGSLYYWDGDVKYWNIGNGARPETLMFFLKASLSAFVFDNGRNPTMLYINRASLVCFTEKHSIGAELDEMAGGYVHVVVKCDGKDDSIWYWA